MSREAHKSDIAFKLYVAATFADISILTLFSPAAGLFARGEGVRKRRGTTRYRCLSEAASLMTLNPP